MNTISHNREYVVGQVRADEVRLGLRKGLKMETVHSSFDLGLDLCLCS